MNIQELEDKHNNVQILFTPKQDLGKDHTKLSVEFAIELLEGINSLDLILNTDLSKEICSKIQELKQYLDEE